MERSPVDLEYTEGLTIPVDHGQLEAKFERPSGNIRASALLCHPHPEYGGNMHTKALYHLARAFNESGVETLRFNFRGVGSSTGEFDGGDGEKDDVRAALKVLREKQNNDFLIMAGFSFGTAVGFQVGVEESDVDAMLGIGLPVSLEDFDYLVHYSCPLLIVQGSLDEFGSPEAVKDVLGTNRDNVTLTVIDGAEHLFHNYFEELKTAVKYFLNSVLTSHSRGVDGQSPNDDCPETEEQN